MASTVFIVVSVVVSGLAMDISINTVVDSFQSASDQSDVNWFSTNIAANAKQLCETSEERVVPLDSSYTRYISGLQGISVETQEQVIPSYGAAPSTTIYYNKFILSFEGGADDKEVTIESESSTYSGGGPDDFSCQTIEFNGTQTGSSIQNLDGSQRYDYRLYSEQEGEVTVEVVESGEA
ncbi:hypothetical protein ACK3SF_00545 [Candidatus Nanosalina sp. VS9-1]|uniref:hypothetical protein n=1 Tax=Candidatus Nanosalina sp. VS9-1 TaxID=3388566 RepID=UPI0039E0EB49